MVVIDEVPIFVALSVDSPKKPFASHPFGQIDSDDDVTSGSVYAVIDAFSVHLNKFESILISAKTHFPSDDWVNLRPQELIPVSAFVDGAVNS